MNTLVIETANGSVDTVEDPELLSVATALADREAEQTAEVLGTLTPGDVTVAATAGVPDSDLIGSAPGQVSEDAYKLIVQFETGGRAYYERVYRSAPCWPGYSSGITIGFGFDLGYYSEADYRTAWSAHLSGSHYDRLKTALGFKTTAKKDTPERAAQVSKARRLVSQFSDIPVPWGTAETVFVNFNLPKQVALTRSHLPSAAQLPADCVGALVSLVFNRGASFSLAGPRYAEMRRIKAHLAAGKPELVPAELRSMKRIWPDSTGSGGLQARREKEALLFERGLALRAQAAAGLFSAVASVAEADSSELTVPVSELPVQNPENDWRQEEAEGELAALSQMDVLSVTASANYRDVYWAADEEQPDYRHLDYSQTGGFEFTAVHMELLLRANSFQPHAGQDYVLFGLRGCRLRGGAHSAVGLDALQLEDTRPNHRHFRCVMGVYHRPSRKLSAFTGSTVPNAWGVHQQYLTNPGGSSIVKTKANILPCGMQAHVVGTHGGHTPGCFLQGTSAGNRLRVVVLRSQNNLAYDVQDIWHDNVPHDNIHPAFSPSTAEFSSYGCFTVKGNYVGGQHIGEWAKFRRAAGLTDGGNHDGVRYSFVLLTGLEALLASRLSEQQASEAELRENLFRLRHGSRGEAVRRLQTALGIGNPDGDFGPVTKKKLTDLQNARLGWADGVFSPEMEQRLGIGGVFG